MTDSRRRWRSALFVPGNDARKLAKAEAGDADAVIIDLEDGVAAAAKPAARDQVAGWAARLKASGHDVVVRVNHGWRDLFADSEAIRGAAIDGVMVPKVEVEGRLGVVSEIIATIGELPPAVGVIALIETPAALPRLAAIAGLPRVTGMAFGSEDYALALGVEPTPDCLDLPCQLVAMAGAGKHVLAAPLSLAQFRDPAALELAYGRAKRLGASGVLCIHPIQVAVANRAFRPSPAEIADAHRALALWEESMARGEAIASVDGKMVDRPVALRLERLLSDEADRQR